MNWRHLQALVWLRWRLMRNQWRRAGTFNSVLMTIAVVGVFTLAIPLFVVCLVAGLYAIPKAEPLHLMYVWDGIVVAFAFFWIIGLITELQRTEPLSLTKILHLPISVTGAFLINYLSSLARLSLVIFLPIMMGFCLALVVVKGPLLLLSVLLSAAFLLMVTALTYQFQGWLATLMSNPRRRRSVIVITTTLFVLVLQAPQLLNFLGVWGARTRADLSKIQRDESQKVQRDFEAGKIDGQEQARLQEESRTRFQESLKRANRDMAARVERTTRLLNQVLPIGWLPLGVMSAAEGRPFAAILGCLGMGLIGSASLWRAYRTTLGLYQGVSNAARRAPAAATPVSPRPTIRKPGVLLLEWSIPGVSEPVAVIMLGALKSLLRSPEAKMMLLTLVILSLVFGSALMHLPVTFPGIVRPLVAIGAMVLVLFSMLQLMSNQFGFDRDGFRVFVLCAASRRDILLGKNLAFAPITLSIAAILLVAVQVVTPLRFDHFLAMVPLYVAMYLLFCLLANLISIYAPLFIAAGSLKPANPKLKTVFLQLVMFMFLFPLTQVPTLLPLGIEAALQYLGWTSRAPICLVLSLVECAAAVWIYRVCLNWQGDLLQKREQRILETVTNRAA